VSRLSRQCGILNITTLCASTACYGDSFTFYLTCGNILILQNDAPSPGTRGLRYTKRIIVRANISKFQRHPNITVLILLCRESVRFEAFTAATTKMASSGMLHRVALVRTDVSHELSASIIKVTRTGELGTMLAVNSTVSSYG
jgi:hypothetical protein